MTSTQAAVTLGTGELNWFTFERVSDRYGTFHLEDTRDHYLDFAGAPFGTRGTLTAEITETRQSFHIGDIARGVGPSTPSVGESITLGEGTLFAEKHDGIVCIGVSPDVDRESDWMDPRALYRCHCQTVRVTFTPGEG